MSPKSMKEIFEDAVRVKKNFLEKIPLVERLSRMFVDTLKAGNKILVCGNGGSASQAQHLSGELVGRYNRNRRSLPCVALTADTGVLTCIGNDYGYDEVFSRQIEALGQKGDLLLALTTSGNSANVINAVKKAKEAGLQTASLLGKDGGKVNSICDLSIVVDSEDTARIQEVHITIIHAVCDVLDAEF